MANPHDPSRLRLFMIAGGGVLALALTLSAVIFAAQTRSSYSDADRAEAAIAVARMDAAQARADQARVQSQKRVYKGY